MSFTQGNIYYQGKTIHRQAETGLICLTDLWKFQGSLEAKSPLDWVRLETTQKLLRKLVEPNETVVVWAESSAKEQSNANQQPIAEIPGILETTKQGQELWTYATEELVVVYARFLSAECYQWSLEYLVEGNQEEADYLEQVEARAKAKRQKQFSRRALIAAGWAVPVVLSVGLNQKAVALPASGGGNTGGIEPPPDSDDNDPHTDLSYIDHTDDFNDSHSDLDHFDLHHKDHTDTHLDSHTDSHTDENHIDIHLDLNYTDHTDNHIDSDLTHLDLNHSDFNPHQDHTDSHIDLFR